ncbi:sulfhydryl oxidase 2-like isoform X1 [Planococcus citri]|uniref:sulfhydryl oxidase 2-like isoform X1 n=1 Tax=Planococcus citri TaxID=170843 RepID=UPI0031F8E125
MIYKYTVICLMALIVLFVIHLLIIKINYIEAVPQESNAAPKTPSGLYVATDKVALLTVNNFNENVYNSTSAWLVQFYNSWCGHCIKFSPIWKQLAASIYNWRNVLVIGAIDCADDQNTQLCREYEIMGYPTVRYFPPLLENFTVGREVSRVFPDPAVLRTEIIKHLQNTETKVPNWPDFSSINSDTIQSVWKVNNSHLLILVVEKDESYVGRELIMDLYGVKNLMVRYTFNADFSNTKEPLPQIFVIKSDYSRKQLPLTNTTRYDVFKTVRNYLLNEGYNVPNVVETESKDTHLVKVKQSAKQQLLVNKVFIEDLESSVSYSLFHEVTLKPKITGEAMNALKGYLQVLSKYFPSNSNIHVLLNAVIHDVRDVHTTTGGDFKRLIIEHSRNLFPLKNKHWVGCKGSTAKYRGYPCSVWMTFHTLSVQAYVNPQRSTGSTEVINAMANYIKNFFGCQDCAEHFQEMSKTIAGNVSTLNDSVLWLWKAHNNVNKRLSGDFSEDPAYPKVQFPASNMCPECRHSNDSWREDKVLSYLVSMYTNMYNVVTLSNGESSTELAKIISEKYVHQKEVPDGWNFSFSDVRTCIGLYVLFACFLTIYTVRFFLKRNRRIKSHKYNYHSKA